MYNMGFMQGIRKQGSRFIQTTIQTQRCDLKALILFCFTYAFFRIVDKVETTQ